jgi:hypothetical protein
MKLWHRNNSGRLQFGGSDGGKPFCVHHFFDEPGYPSIRVRIIFVGGMVDTVPFVRVARLWGASLWANLE